MHVFHLDGIRSGWYSWGQDVLRATIIWVQIYPTVSDMGDIRAMEAYDLVGLIRCPYIGRQCMYCSTPYHVYDTKHYRT